MLKKKCFWILSGVHLLFGVVIALFVHYASDQYADQAKNMVFGFVFLGFLSAGVFNALNELFFHVVEIRQPSSQSGFKVALLILFWLSFLVVHYVL